MLQLTGLLRQQLVSRLSVNNKQYALKAQEALRRTESKMIMIPVTLFILLLIAISVLLIDRLPKKEALKISFLIVIVLFIGAIFVMLIPGVTDGPGSAYDAVKKQQIQNAVTAYSANSSHSGEIPVLSGTYTNANCSNCSVVNISALITANGGILRAYPDGLNLSASGNDNCGGNASLGCRNTNSYIWLVDKEGDVYSYCAGAGCTTNNSGYQGVWP